MPSTGFARILLAAVVLGTLATTSAVAVTLPARAPDVDPAAADPPTTATPTTAPVTGADIAAPVLDPERERASAVMTRSYPAPRPPGDATIPDADDEIWAVLSERMRESVREACAADRLDGPVCERV